MRLAVLLSWILFALATATQLSSQVEWNNFKVAHNKTYSSKEEEDKRMRIFQENKKLVEEHNKKYDRGMVSFKMGINKFSDLTTAEFNQKKHPFPAARRTRILQTWNASWIPTRMEALHSLDWREKGAVTEVKDQGYCTSCWIFSAVGAVEAQHFFKTGELVALSEQNVLDCLQDEHDDASGCPIGWMEDAFEFIKANGIDTEKSYPYEAQPSSCRFSEDSLGATIDGYEDLPVGDETVLRRALTAYGPISVAFNSKGDFKHYRSGVYASDSCGNSEEDLDHPLLLVGYGKEAGQPYWLVKNSWGTTWGDAGYAKIGRNMGNLCGIATRPSYPYIN